jgi:hypothetical protein
VTPDPLLGARLPARRRISVRRRLAVATWRPAKDGRIYARMAVDATPLLAYVERARARTGVHVTVTHVIGAALARAIREVPEVRARVVFGRIREFDSCDIGFAVDIDGGSDLAPVKVLRADEKTPAEIAREVIAGSVLLRTGDDEGYRRSSSIARTLPWWALRPLAGVASLVVGGLGVSAFGQPGHPLARHSSPTSARSGWTRRSSRRCRSRGCRSTSRSVRCATPRSSWTARWPYARRSCWSPRPTTGWSTEPMLVASPGT